MYYGSPFPPLNKIKKVICDFLSHNSDYCHRIVRCKLVITIYTSYNCEIKTCKSDFIPASLYIRNYAFFVEIQIFFLRIVRYKLAIAS